MDIGWILDGYWYGGVLLTDEDSPLECAGMEGRFVRYFVQEMVFSE
ncbi:hypothetical protein [Paenibacillus antibioticophila]|nr:hypothetical protein [Paenibacillus antibioticophila]